MRGGYMDCRVKPGNDEGGNALATATAVTTHQWR